MWIILILISLEINGQTFQNLVPNWSFETSTQCPSVTSQVTLAVPWTAPVCSSSDYFNACSNNLNVPHYGGISSSYPYYRLAKQGQAFAGISLYQMSSYREYLQVKLIDTLTPNTCYYVECFASSIQFNKYASNNICMNLSPVSSAIIPNSCSILSLTPHITRYGNPVINDTANWVPVSGLYQSAGNEAFLTIGNFFNDNQTDTVNMYPSGTTPYYVYPNSYAFIDAVSVFSINPSGTLPWTYRDTTIILGDSVYIGNYIGGNFNPQWFTISGSYIATNAGIYVKPIATNSYVVNYTVCGVSRLDTIEVKVVSGQNINEKELKKIHFKISPNPAKDEIEIEFANETAITKPKELKIIDVLGKEVKQLFVYGQKTKINTANLQNGVYFISIKNELGGFVSKKIIVAK